MKFKEYQKECLVTAVYNPEKLKITYPILGLLDEMIELREKLEDICSNNMQRRLKYNLDDIAYECGDCTWYTVVSMYDLGIELTETDIELFDKDVRPVMLVAGKIAGRWKKVLRDYNGVLADEKRSEFKLLFVELLAGFARLFENLGLTFEKVTDMNIAKLKDRRARGVVRGEGDKR